MNTLVGRIIDRSSTMQMQIAEKTSSGSKEVALAFVGDSDISHWPTELLPIIGKRYGEPRVSGHSGATLNQIIPHVRSVVELVRNDTISKKLVLVACAGENDIGNCYSINQTMDSFRKLLTEVFVSTAPDSLSTYLIFLGPKLEPWLEDDHGSRKKYVKLAKALRRACEQQEFSGNITFVDCLTMFCGESANIPGALFGGKAMAETKYFSDDRLHLNAEGYKVWKATIDQHIMQILDG